MRVTNSEISELNHILLEIGYDTSIFVITRGESLWQIKLKPDEFYFKLRRRAADYVIQLLYADKLPKSAIIKRSFPEVKEVFELWSKQIWNEIISDPNFKPTKKKIFSKRINEISPRFQNIFNQSLQAEILSLNEVCGTGFRKALEFLIKDYLILKVPKSEHDYIKKNAIVRCIKKYDEALKREIKVTSERAFWLGNDHAHFVQVWEDKTLSDLKELIFDCVDWIEKHDKVDQLEKSMPDKNKS